MEIDQQPQEDTRLVTVQEEDESAEETERKSWIAKANDINTSTRDRVKILNTMLKPSMQNTPLAMQNHMNDALIKELWHYNRATTPSWIESHLKERISQGHTSKLMEYMVALLSKWFRVWDKERVLFAKHPRGEEKIRLCWKTTEWLKKRFVSLEYPDFPLITTFIDYGEEYQRAHPISLKITCGMDSFSDEQGRVHRRLTTVDPEELRVLEEQLARSHQEHPPAITSSQDEQQAMVSFDKEQQGQMQEYYAQQLSLKEQ